MSEIAKVLWLNSIQNDSPVTKSHKSFKNTDMGSGSESESRRSYFHSIAGIENDPDKIVVMTGELLKKCPMNPILWQTRYVVLNASGTLYYYASEHDYMNGKDSRGCIKSKDIRLDAPNEGIQAVGDVLNIFVYSKNNRTYQWQCKTPTEAHIWAEAIRASQISNISDHVVV
jgi:hypothetical protein